MNPESIEIRPVTAADREQWQPLWQGYLEFYRASLAARVTELLWQRILDPAQEIHALVAERDGGLLGLVHFFPHAHTWYADPVCYLNDLFVAPSVRGGGIGRRLIEAVTEQARQRGWAEVYWLTQAENATARTLYDRVTGGTDGFVNYSIDPTKPTL